MYVGRRVRSAISKGKTWPLMIAIMVPLIVLSGFQNCAKFKSTTETFSSVIGSKGEVIHASSPTSMYKGGGTLVIYGSGFTSLTEVTVGGQACGSIDLVSGSELQCQAPTLPPGIYSIVVSGATLPVRLTYKDFTTVTTVAGRNGIQGTVDGVSRLARLNNVNGMVSDGNRIYFSDYANSVIRYMDLDTAEVKTIGGSPTGGSGYVNAVGADARFKRPAGLALLNGKLYIGDYENCALRVMDLDTLAVTTLVGDPEGSCDSVDGTFATAQIGRIDGLAVHEGKLIVHERTSAAAHVIRSYDLQAQTITTLLGDKDVRIDTWVQNSFWAPEASALDKELTLPAIVESAHPAAYETYDFNIQASASAVGMRLHFTRLQLEDGEEITIEDTEGNTLWTYTGDHGTDFWSPVFPGKEVKVLFYGYDYGSYGFSIDKVQYVETENVNWTHSYDGPGADTLVGDIGDLVVAGGKLYFGDSDLSVIRSYDFATGKSAGVAGAYEGVQTATDYRHIEVGNVVGLAVDGGTLIVSDVYRNSIWRFNLSTRTSSPILAPDPSAGSAANIDGPVATASVNLPMHLIFDPERGIYFDVHDAIRRIK